MPPQLAPARAGSRQLALYYATDISSLLETHTLVFDAIPSFDVALTFGLLGPSMTWPLLPAGIMRGATTRMSGYARRVRENEEVMWKVLLGGAFAGAPASLAACCGALNL